MKHLLIIACLISFLKLNAQHIEEIDIPNGVVYNYTDDSIVKHAKHLIALDLTDSNSYSVSGSFLVVGPVLWKRFKKVKTLKEIQGGNTTFLVDNNKLTGKLSQSVDDSKLIWDALRNEIGSQNYNIRKANPNELKYYWSVISFDIVEPLLIVETTNHSYILNLGKSDLKLMWIDEMPR